VIRLAAAFVCVTALAADWPQLLGPQRNGVSAEQVSLRNPRQLWKKDIGAGFSAPVLASGKLILFHRLGNQEVVEALNPATGAPLWKFEYATTYRDDFGFDEGPRGTPAVADGRVYTHGAEGVLHALDLNTGRKVWRVDTFPKFGIQKQFFGAAASPLAGDAVYLNVGGTAGIAAFDKNNGDVLWTATKDEAGYSSPIAAKDLILCLTRAGLAAVSADGKVRFQFPWRSRSHASVNAALPVVAGNLVFISASYSTGSAVLDLSSGEPKKLWASDDALSNHYATSVFREGFVYGFHGRQEHGQELRCIEMRTGKVMWSVPGFGAGTVTLTGDRLFVLREDGEAVVAPAVPSGFKPEGRARLLPGVVRSYPAISDGRVFLRNERTLAAYDVGVRDVRAIFGGAVEHFRAGRVKESAAAFDEVVQLAPDAAPELWQRGISLYYAGRYKECRHQFESHRTVNPNDVENAAWHFLCVARESSAEEARRRLLPVGPDRRVPMKQIYAMFRGDTTPDAVITAAGSDTEPQFYARLYAGLYQEAVGKAKESVQHMRIAAQDRYAAGGYMHTVAKVHLKLRQ
jgi:outer membrane protein assembly factor BamB